MRVFAIILSTVIGVSLIGSTIVAEAKTAKECRAEWQANKADFQAKKIKQKDYVTQCTAGAAAAPPAATQPTATQPTATENKTKKTRAKKTESKTAPAPVTPTATESAPAPKPAPAARPSRAVTGANQFTTESQAKSRCGSDTVVWANLNSKVYHFVGNHAYGTTKSGAYMCERDAMSGGMRAAKNEKHP
jgi:hypothetical protein